jgi:hypothetical protein
MGNSNSGSTGRIFLVVVLTLAALIVLAFFVQKALAQTVEGGLMMDSQNTWDESGDNTWDPGAGYYVRDAYSAWDGCIGAGCTYFSDPYPTGESDRFSVGSDPLPDAYGADLAQSADSLAGWHFSCRTVWAIVTHSGTFGDLYKAKWSQDFCYNGIRVANVGNLRDKCWTTGLGDAAGWSCNDDVGGDANGHYNNSHKSHTSWTRVQFKDCLPIPTGCLDTSTVYWKGNMQVFRKGGFIFHKNNG